MWVLEGKITQEDSEYFKKAIRNFVIINTLLSLIYGIIIGALINLVGILVLILLVSV